MTFSLVGHCAETGQLGIAICSSSIAVGARCPWLQPGVGAVSTQNITLPALGPQVLEHMACGLSPTQALDSALTRNGYSQFRQLAAIDYRGRTAHFSGSETLGCHHTLPGELCVGAGNLLAGASVIEALVRTFETSGGQLADRLLAGMQAAVAAGGEAGPVHSAALVVVGELTWPIIDLRVDWADEDPVGKLAQLWAAYRPQMQDYIVRALDPTQAPSYGVPGDE
ncbi:DUF1028 domain-containing protein [Pseudomonas typographi]|uniref:DUF1028 domain-containing protein n=1 Tax=Pseudomonas typographi TaxID=2715964 RepID=A0ABR7Z2K9_9PSED|nr:DUF1028 domain-containing protein [Pseudomonas typographi]MBD1550328.1 DUF1028 domain-containing protein [Pseudomonas typographi]MBD1585906.1 DUF1028 domain-containing protein [Pseudomonas typographi]MBD1599728.1 DUF1028 domain-containing protein [Pseudomonas typographi]